MGSKKRTAYNDKRPANTNAQTLATFTSDALEKTHPPDTDVVVGRGKRVQRHPGNICFLEKIDELLDVYHNCERGTKKHVVTLVLNWLRSRNGHFVIPDAEGNWIQLGKAAAREKVALAFRHRRIDNQNRQRGEAEKRRSKRSRSESESSPLPEVSRLDPDHDMDSVDNGVKKKSKSDSLGHIMQAEEMAKTGTRAIQLQQQAQKRDGPIDLSSKTKTISIFGTTRDRSIRSDQSGSPVQTRQAEEIITAPRDLHFEYLPQRKDAPIDFSRKKQAISGSAQARSNWNYQSDSPLQTCQTEASITAPCTEPRETHVELRPQVKGFPIDLSNKKGIISGTTVSRSVWNEKSGSQVHTRQEEEIIARHRAELHDFHIKHEPNRKDVPIDLSRMTGNVRARSMVINHHSDSPAQSKKKEEMIAPPRTEPCDLYLKRQPQTRGISIDPFIKGKHRFGTARAQYRLMHQSDSPVPSEQEEEIIETTPMPLNHIGLRLHTKVTPNELSKRAQNPPDTSRVLTTTLFEDRASDVVDILRQTLTNQSPAALARETDGQIDLLSLAQQELRNYLAESSLATEDVANGHSALLELGRGNSSAEIDDYLDRRSLAAAAFRTHHDRASTSLSSIEDQVNLAQSRHIADRAQALYAYTRAACVGPDLLSIYHNEPGADMLGQLDRLGRAGNNIGSYLSRSHDPLDEDAGDHLELLLLSRAHRNPGPPCRARSPAESNGTRRDRLEDDIIRFTRCYSDALRAESLTDPTGLDDKN